MPSPLAQPLTLPCGAVVPNRLVKAAMTEGLATPRGVPTPALERLYGLWSDGGAGTLLTGNIQVDHRHLERPGNVIIEGEPDPELRAALANWARVGTRRGNHLWAQISHAGRQTQRVVNRHPKAPSAVKLGLPGGQFGEPVALTVHEIEDIVRRFGIAAAACSEAGFTGVQIHAAHGYLLSEFLSPRVNRRTDQYGGDLANRARALLEVVQTVRAAVGPGFPVSVKLNSADFQKGGFSFEDSLQVAQWLEQAGIDVLEVSGGTYEQPKLLGLAGIEAEEDQRIVHSTRMREAYFIDFAIAMQQQLSVPLLVTGGFRTRAVMEQAIESGSADLIGLARPLCVDADGPARLLTGAPELPRYEQELTLLPGWLACLTRIPAIRSLAGFGVIYWFYAQLDALARTGTPEPDLSVFEAMKRVMRMQRKLLKSD